MKIDNSIRYLEVTIEGESTKEKYYGRFGIQPFLKHAEKADAQRLADKWTSGMEESSVKDFMRLLAYLSFHVKDAADAPWWTSNGLDLLDEAPAYELAKQLDLVRTPKKTEENV